MIVFSSEGYPILLFTLPRQGIWPKVFGFELWRTITTALRPPTVLSMKNASFENMSGPFTQNSGSVFEESCGLTVLDLPESKEVTEQIDCREKQPPQAACV